MSAETTVFVWGNMIWNASIVAVAAYLIKRWISGTDKKFDDLRTEAEARGLRLHIRLDEITACMTGVKLNVEKKVDKDVCANTGRERQQALLDHEHACCAGRDARVIP